MAELKERVRIEKKLVSSLDSEYTDTRICLPTLKHGDTELFLMSFRLAPASDPRLRIRKSSDGSEDLTFRLSTQHLESSNCKHSAVGSCRSEDMNLAPLNIKSSRFTQT